jgi:hypothetical protein
MVRKFLCNVDPFAVGFFILLTIGMSWAAWYDIMFFWIISASVVASFVIVGALFGLTQLIKWAQSKCKKDEDGDSD